MTVITRVASWVRQLYELSIFHPFTVLRATPNDVLAVLFHRSAATLYLIYSLWGIAATLGGIPTIVEAQGELWQTVFSLLVVVTCAPACVGATFFPRTGRLEMYMASGFVGLMGLYLLLIFVAGIVESDSARFVGFVLVSSVVVVPLSRVIFIFITLTRMAAKKAEADDAS